MEKKNTKKFIPGLNIPSMAKNIVIPIMQKICTPDPERTTNSKFISLKIKIYNLANSF